MADESLVRYVRICVEDLSDKQLLDLASHAFMVNGHWDQLSFKVPWSLLLLNIPMKHEVMSALLEVANTRFQGGKD